MENLMNLEMRLLQDRCGTRAIIEHSEQNAEWIFENLIEKGEQWIISGAPKAGKSRLALQLALSASEGASFLDFKCPRKQRVLYVDFELSPRISAHRVLDFYKNDREKLIMNKSFYKCSDHKIIDVNSTNHCNLIKNIVETLKPDLVIWDVLARMHSADENNNIAMTQVMQNIRLLSCGAAHIVVHHARKEIYGNGGAKSLRGASSIHGEADGVMALALENSKMGSYSLLFSTRAIDDPGKIWLKGDGLGFIKATKIASDEKNKSQLILGEIFKDQTTITKAALKNFIEASLEIRDRQAERKIDELVLSGKLLKTKKGREMLYSHVK